MLLAGDLLGTVMKLTNYTKCYEALAAIFPTENIHLVKGEKLVTDPLQEIKKVEAFLDLPKFFSKNHFYYPKEKNKFPCFKQGKKTSCMHADKGRDHPPLKRETMKYLNNYFHPMVDKLLEDTGVCLH